MKKIVLAISFLFFMKVSYSQVLIMSTSEGMRNPKLDYEHGYMPGKIFPFYQTIEKYDFNGLRVRVELFDDRKKLNLASIICSPLAIENISEFADTKSIYKVAKYIDTILKQSNIVIDTASNELIEIRLEALDSRLIGFGYIKVHGLCQIKVIFKEENKTYCIDIKDGDKNSPIGSNALVTRKSGTRIMGSASIREVIERFLVDLRTMN